MRNVFAINALMLAVTLQSHAQDLDSLKQKILKMDIAINAMHYNMTKAHKQFRTGTYMMIAGTVATIIGTMVLSEQAIDGNNNRDQPTLLYVGAGLMTAGGVIQIDSHKWLGRGGRRHIKATD